MLAASLLGTVCYAVSCEDFVGTWKGKLDNYPSYFIMQNTEPKGAAMVTFGQGSKRQFKMQFQRCKQNGPHQLFIDYRFDYGDHHAILSAMVGVYDEKMDTITVYFNYNAWDGHVTGFGKLQKQ